jgi:hypothetical protein
MIVLLALVFAWGLHEGLHFDWGEPDRPTPSAGHAI